MKKRKLIFIIAVMTVFMLAFTTVFVSAESLSEIRQQIKDKEAALEKGREQEESLAKQVTALEEELAKLEVAIAEGENKLEKLKKEVEEAEEKVETQTTNLNARLRNMYKSGNMGFIDVLLDSGSISEFLTNYEMVKKIYSSDQEVLKELEKAHDELEAKKKEAEELQAELEESRTVTAEQKSVVEANKKKISASNTKTQDMLNDLQAEADRMTAEIQGSSNPDKPYAGGEMAWPAPSCPIITSSFGWRTGTYSGWHSGIDLAGSGCYGTRIVAANSGKVTAAGWNSGGYGYYVTIDHGGGVTTLYAHASRVAVSRGQYVSRGQTIAYIGSTGYSTGPHLHFEVRINGVCKNPYPYIT